MSGQSSRKLPVYIRPLMLEITHQLTLAFLHADIAVVNELQFKFGVLLPEADAGFLGWMRYWNALPAATMLERETRSESALEPDFIVSQV
jgi:hypothetical protein